MAFGDNSTITGRLAVAFPKMARAVVADIQSKQYASLYAMRGESVYDRSTDMFKFVRSKDIEGTSKEFSINGALPTFVPVTPGTAEEGAYTSYRDFNEFVNAKVDLTYIPVSVTWTVSEERQLRGKQVAKIALIDELVKRSVKGYMRTLNGGTYGLGSTNAPSASSVGGLDYAISDGVSTGETAYAVYCTINRGDSANAQFRSGVATSVGSIALADLDTAQTAIMVQGGTPKLAICNQTPYNGIKALLQEGERFTTVNGEMNFSGPHLIYSGINILLDPDCISDNLYMMDPEAFMWIENQENYTLSDVVLQSNTIGSFRGSAFNWAQAILVNPRLAYKLTGIS